MNIPRIDYYTASPAAVKAMLAMSASASSLGLEHSLLELVKMRASQINGCAFCLDMHGRDARRTGESEQRLYVLPAWRETELFSRREQAALAWTEALTLVTEGHAPDAVYDFARSEFSDAELVNLTLAITTINAWNRFAIGFRKPLPAAQ
ncbi:carboxymuconolactone decarboxylase family protein [Roseateles saccharophilus]|uniref:AhpD family alkylhydroperoxidase n=1 Tax=Roseateles saccharophilus TaxID=304 RepID=A0A4R3URB0_ROSSA|nr:carboxymuconolactone decarboxylase family protein [Roseateles saccharophilus]MDG0833225.1 carboxymuconolactone decarboxylase family protein [Roseateles saccharophilus]TCU94426.1 AhpD family alkylhydroperoxidase [Roseateles saccharophilus]